MRKQAYKISFTVTEDTLRFIYAALVSEAETFIKEGDPRKPGMDRVLKILGDRIDWINAGGK